FRVLDRGGLLYVAVPNRWTLIEPHYNIPFLSWLPTAVASRLVRLSGKGDWFDCHLLSRNELARMLSEKGFLLEDVTFDALELYIKKEITNKFLSLLFRWIPR